MLQHLVGGLTALDSGSAITLLFVGALVGMFIGVIPGLSGAVILSVVLALINHFTLTEALCLFLGTQAGGFFSASITSILLNTPAHPEAFAVTFDGFPMAQKGQAGRALGISAASTCLGGFVGCIVVIGLIQIMNPLALLFHAPDYVAMIMLALVLIGTLGTDAVSKALISAGIGIALGSVGVSSITGDARFTFGTLGLFSGFSLVAIALGSFGVPQMVMMFGTASTVARQDMLGNEVQQAQAVDLSGGFRTQVLGGIRETFHHWVVLIRAGLIGAIAGIIPGIGGFSANFISYSVAQQTSKTPELFGTGIAEGIIAPEGSSLSKEAGGLVPLLSLGIPGGVAGALFLAALAIKNVRTGYGFATTYPVLPYEMLWIIALAGLIGTIAGVFAAPLLARVTRVPGLCLVPFLLPLAAVGPFVATSSFFTVVSVFPFALIGLCLRRLRYSLASFVVGIVLGPTLETNIYITHETYHGVSFFAHPLSDFLILLTIAILLLKSIQLRRDAKKIKLPPEDETSPGSTYLPYPLLGVLVALGVVAFSLFVTIYGVIQYNFDTAIMPVLGGGLAGLAALWRLPWELRRYLSYRRTKADSVQVHRPASNENQLVEVGASFTSIPSFSGSSIGPLSSDSGRGIELGLPNLHKIAEKEWGFHGQYTREIVALVWFATLMFACWLFGFKFGVPMFCIAYGVTATRRVFKTFTKRLLFALFCALLMWALTFEVFNILHLLDTPIVSLK